MLENNLQCCMATIWESRETVVIYEVIFAEQDTNDNQNSQYKTAWKMMIKLLWFLYIRVSLSLIRKYNKIAKMLYYT